MGLLSGATVSRFTHSFANMNMQHMDQEPLLGLLEFISFLFNCEI